ncbi:hypothetical protein OD350_29215 (plasmid) [Clostridium beijerinckii]|uniref:AAA family ATPase n=1 Tax=Clostridium beijerinckii TaxID=1520 RepID=UPI002226B573|nr:hypothetical protein [Clostridium beijerinckii]UYZ38970.1 hypothetical protein OD350_29215 [Clostridium beijerinckii]
MFIQAIAISGFKNHKEFKSFKFSYYSEILGKNAKGKTTIGEAITWGLYGCDLTGDIKSDTKLMNNNSDHMFVIIDYEYQGVMNRIVRKRTVKSLTLKLNDERITEKELSKHLPNKDLFLSIFNTKVFLSYTTSKQRELLLKRLPKIDYNDIINKYDRKDLKELLNKYPNINDGLKKLRTQISNKEDTLTSKKVEINVLQKLILENTEITREISKFTNDDKKRLNELETQLLNKKSSVIELISSDSIKSKINEVNTLITIEKNKEFKSLNTNNIQELNLSLATLAGEYKYVLDTYIKFTTLDSVCSMCGQPITEEHRQREQQLLLEKMDNIQSQIDDLNESISLLKSLDEDNKKSFNENTVIVLSELRDKKKALEDELKCIEESNKLLNETSLNSDTNDIEIEINNLKQKQVDYINYQANIKSQIKNEANYKIKVESIENEIISITNEKNNLDIQYANLKDFSSLYVQYIGEILSSWLDKVSLNLFTVTDYGEIKDTFEIKYDNKPLRLISNSEYIKVCLEISNMFNNTLGINLPVFVDDAESILEIPKLSTQMIIAKVKDCEFEITSVDEINESTNSNTDINKFNNIENNDINNIAFNVHEDKKVLASNLDVQQLCFA